MIALVDTEKPSIAEIEQPTILKGINFEVKGKLFGLFGSQIDHSQFFASDQWNNKLIVLGYFELYDRLLQIINI